MRCGVYVRVSTDDQRDNGYSIDSQLRMIKEYCEKCFLQALFGQSCKTFLDIIASPNWTKLQSLDWQLSCQPHSHCRQYLVVTA